MPHRNAESVLPEPVGARISVWAPLAMAGQPFVWGGVASGNEVLNQARTAGENGARGSGGTRTRLPTDPVRRCQEPDGLAGAMRSVPSMFGWMSQM